MTDISIITPTTVSHTRPLQLRLPRLAIGASIDAMARLIGNALSMAYVEPYSRHHRERVVPDEDLGGRDPSW